MRHTVINVHIQEDKEKKKENKADTATHAIQGVVLQQALMKSTKRIR